MHYSDLGTAYESNLAIWTEGRPWDAGDKTCLGETFRDSESLQILQGFFVTWFLTVHRIDLCIGELLRTDSIFDPLGSIAAIHLLSE